MDDEDSDEAGTAAAEKQRQKKVAERKAAPGKGAE
jgi:hypothetical protein